MPLLAHPTAIPNLARFLSFQQRWPDSLKVEHLIRHGQRERLAYTDEAAACQLSVDSACCYYVFHLCILPQREANYQPLRG
jgi:hypothetical protein